MSFWDGTRWVPETEIRAARTTTRPPRRTHRSRTPFAILLALAIAMPVASIFASAPTLSMSPASGPAGTSVTVRGSGFPSKVKVQLTWDGDPTNMPRASTNVRGAFSATLTIPKAAPGDHVLAAVVTSGSGAKAARIVAGTAITQATFDVTDAPAVDPTPDPTVTPTPDPTPKPTPDPTPTPTPAATPTPDPTSTPTPAPTSTATPAPTTAPTSTPTPTPAPTATPTPAPTTGYPADTTLAYIATPALARPAYLSTLADPVLGTRTTRISDIAGARQAYSRLSAWNADGSKILLGFTYPGRMLDGRTFADLGPFYQISGAIWSNVDPNTLYGVDAPGNGGRLYRQNATTGALTVLHAFTGYSYVTIGDGEGGISDDDRYIALIGTTATGGRHLITYDVAAAIVVGDIVAPAGIDNAQISRKGSYVVAVGSFGTRAYARNLSSYRQLTSTGNHGDNALSMDGREIYVGNNANEFGGTEVVAFDLATGVRTILLSGSAFEYGHSSGRNIGRPGWVYLSVYDNSVTASRPGNDQVVAVRTDGSGTVEVFAFAHHNDCSSYAAQTQAVPSPDGKHVLFASEWGGSSVFAYVASH